MSPLDYMLQRRRSVQIADEASSEPTNVIDAYTWDIAYSGEYATADDWAPLPTAGQQITLTQIGAGTPTLDYSTDGLAPVGIGAARVDKAVYPNGGAIYRSLAMPWAGGVWHQRLIVRGVASTPATAYIYWHYHAAGVNNLGVSLNTAESLVLGYDTAALPLWNASTVGVASPEWYLVDYVYDPVGNGGGGRLMTWRNGTEVVGNNASSYDFASTGTYLLCGVGGVSGTSMPTGQILFCGSRYLSSPSEFGADDHNADLVRLGLA